ncbi:MAG: hypothetical protein AAGA27_07470, partial [Pseudomonadota bacterium]
NIPIWDSWKSVFPLIIKIFYLHKSLSWHDLVQINVSHRVIITRLIFLADYYLFSGSRYIVLLLCFCFQLGTFLLVITRFYTVCKRKEIKWWFISFIIATLIFSPRGSANWTWAFASVQQILSVFFILCAIALLSTRFNFLFKIVLILIFSLLATASSANGLLVWPIMVLGLILQKRNWKVILFYAVVGTIIIIFYMQGHFYITAMTPGSGGLLFWQYILYALAFLGASFSSLSPYVVLALGALIFIIFLCIYADCICKFFTNKLDDELLLIVLLSLFALCSAIMAAWGRLTFPGHFEKAFQSRYIPFQSLAPIAAIIYFILLLKKQLFQKLIITVLILILTITSIISYPKNLGVDQVLARQITLLALQNNILTQYNRVINFSNYLILDQIKQAKKYELFGIGTKTMINKSISENKMHIINESTNINSMPLFKAGLKKGKNVNHADQIKAAGFIPGYQREIYLSNSFNEYNHLFIIHNSIIVGKGQRTKNLLGNKNTWGIFWTDYKQNSTPALICFSKDNVNLICKYRFEYKIK